MMEESEFSEMSLGVHDLLTTRGSSMLPRRTDVERHSLITEVSVSDCCQEYQRQASPGWQYPCWFRSDGLKRSQLGLSEAENKLPHRWHFTAPEVDIGATDFSVTASN